MAEGDVMDVPCKRQSAQPCKLGLCDGGGCSSCFGAGGGLTSADGFFVDFICDLVLKSIGSIA